MEFVVLLVRLSPVVLVLFVATQLNDDATLGVNEIPGELPLQMVVEAVFIITGAVFIVTVKV